MLNHVVLEKAHDMFGLQGATGQRIGSIDDRVFFKVKVQRWRGALWQNDPAQWLCAAGLREAGSPDDFYEDLATRCVEWRKRYNQNNSPPRTTNTCSDPLLPTNLDQRRLDAEALAARAFAYKVGVPRLLRDALLTGVEQQDRIEGYVIAILAQQRGEEGVYVGIAIQGAVSENNYSVILERVPGTTIDDWQVDKMPHRDTRPNELVLSTMIEPEAVNDLLSS